MRPTLWAEVNAKAVESRGKTGEALFFMRAGFTGVQAHCPLIWGGDQSVDFSRHDGLVTVICGALSSGLMGNAYHHSDIGGYTSLFGNVRTAELIMRWTEMAAFTPVMRTHEGNRPRDNLQIDQDEAVLAHFARMTSIYVALAPYLKSLSAEAARRACQCSVRSSFTTRMTGRPIPFRTAISTERTCLSRPSGKRVKRNARSIFRATVNGCTCGAARIIPVDKTSPSTRRSASRRYSIVPIAAIDRCLNSFAPSAER